MSLLYPITNLTATEQLVVERGEGVYVYDNRGRRYLEGMAGLWCTALGYSNEELVEVAHQQMRDLTFAHLFGGKSHPAAIELATKLADMVPVENARVFLGNSGSDANDTLIKIIRYHANVTGREKHKIIARERAYHGLTIGAAALTGLVANHTHFAVPFEALGILRTGSAHFYRDGLEGETEEEFAARRARELEELILAEGPETIAAFIAEPVAGAGGVMPPPVGYFDKVQEVLAKYDVMFWDDEVITGFGRLGADFGASVYNLRPRLMTMAKALSSAYMPISASVVSGDIYDALVEPSAEVGIFGHGYTYGGHPVACAVASRVLDIYRRDRVFEHAAEAGAYLQERLGEFRDHPLVGEVRGVGMVAALELVADKGTRRAVDKSVGMFCQRACESHGVILRAVGGNSIAVCPPLIITHEQIDELVEKLALALGDTLDYATRGVPGRLNAPGVYRAVGGNSMAVCPPLTIAREQIDELVEKLALALGDALDYATRESLVA